MGGGLHVAQQPRTNIPVVVSIEPFTDSEGETVALGG